MFFAHKVKSIKPGDRVLEIGPGGTPHSRADVFLDLDPKIFKDDTEAAHQRGLAPPLKTKKPIVYYDGKTFPFKDKEFDYVICSHVLEHVEDVDAFLKELFRISKKGYLEFPSILYDYIYDIPVHPNFVRFNKQDKTIYWLKKRDTSFADFKDVQHFFFVSVAKGHDCLIKSLEQSMIQGFEWKQPIKSKKAKSISQLVPPLSTIQKPLDMAPKVITQTETVERALGSHSTLRLALELSRRPKRKLVWLAKKLLKPVRQKSQPEYEES